MVALGGTLFLVSEGQVTGLGAPELLEKVTSLTTRHSHLPRHARPLETNPYSFIEIMARLIRPVLNPIRDGNTCTGQFE